MRQGVEGSAVSQLTSSAPSGRSLVVPLHVLGSLVAQGVISNDAVSSVIERLTARRPEFRAAEAALCVPPCRVFRSLATDPLCDTRQLPHVRRPAAILQAGFRMRGGSPGADRRQARRVVALTAHAEASRQPGPG